MNTNTNNNTPHIVRVDSHSYLKINKLNIGRDTIATTTNEDSKKAGLTPDHFESAVTIQNKKKGNTTVNYKSL